MNWYLTKIVFQIDIGKGKNSNQFDEQLRLIKAASTEEAFFKARSIGKNEEVDFLNKNNSSVSWKFIDVAEIHPLKQWEDGAEICSSTHESEEANAYISFVKHKAMVLQTQHQLFV
ncbi:MAG TPA: DUF4288 domain-containing protein [Bacteroidia bacterium]|nr:DUF4288 domain-containing protein [Bacteroidia bacterium]HRH08438.1 DUF4288 domain-containing protein [Bacteroidia bacterium]